MRSDEVKRVVPRALVSRYLTPHQLLDECQSQPDEDHTLIMRILLYLVVMRVHLLHQARVASSSYIGQCRIYIPHFAIHRHDRLGSANKLSVPRAVCIEYG